MSFDGTQIKNLIDGKLVDPLSNEYMDNYNPGTGKVFSKVADSSAEDIERAVQAAKRAFPEWSTRPTRERSHFLRKIADEIQKNVEDIARAESMDNGKPISVARTLDAPRSAQNFEFYADLITAFSSDCHITDVTAVNYTIQQPLGVVACISPWNFPLHLLTWKVAPALAAGNCVVAKPSEITPLTAYLLSEIAIKVGLPKGVLNIVHGRGGKIGDALTSHREIKAVSFTGSTQTGQTINQSASKSFKKVALEMGGKNANVVFADCDLEKAVEGALKAGFSNQGQVCTCGSRIFVEKKIYNEFKEKLLQKVSSLKPGNPADEKTQHGALVSKQHMEKVLSYLELAKKEGGRVLCGGKQGSVGGSDGYYVEPTLIEGLDASCKTNQEEIFGPVATLIPFDSEREAIDWANGTRYGLAASIWTENVSKAHRVARQLDAGIVWVNNWMMRDLRTPFGGMKDSGVGREGGMNALKFFTEPKNVCIKI